MEQLKIALILWGSIGITACIFVLCLLDRNQKRDPRFLTSQASPRDKQKARKIILGFLSVFIIYAVLFMFVIAYMVYAEIPMILLLLGTVFIGGVIIMAFFGQGNK